MFGFPQLEFIFASAYEHGTLAQLVEQRTENPCVPGSIPGGTTKSAKAHSIGWAFVVLEYEPSEVSPEKCIVYIKVYFIKVITC